MKQVQRVPSVVLVSGGLDSAANLALCVERDEPLLALTCQYGQKAEKRELESAKKLAHYYDVPLQVIELPWLGQLGGSALTDAEQVIPHLKSENLEDPLETKQSAKAVWVPNRNGVFIQVAAAFAERIGAKRVVVGFNREEAKTFSDNSIEFLRAATEALRFSTATQVTLFSYTSELNKKEIVKALYQLKRHFPFDKIWSCYKGDKMPCGFCESCQRYQRALGQASDEH
jgi:7-cyano-7-deazaguanine synthase